MGVCNLDLAASRIQVYAISCDPYVFAYACCFAFHNGRLPTTVFFPAPNARRIFRLVPIKLLCVAGAVPASLRY